MFKLLSRENKLKMLRDRGMLYTFEEHLDKYRPLKTITHGGKGDFIKYCKDNKIKYNEEHIYIDKLTTKDFKIKDNEYMCRPDGNITTFDIKSIKILNVDVNFKLTLAANDFKFYTQNSYFNGKDSVIDYTFMKYPLGICRLTWFTIYIEILNDIKAIDNYDIEIIYESRDYHYKIRMDTCDDFLFTHEYGKNINDKNNVMFYRGFAIEYYL